MSGAIVDPYYLDPDLYPGNQLPDPAGRVLVSALTESVSRLAVIITLGQSLMANYVGGSYTPKSPHIHNLNIYDGGLYQAQEPLLGCDYWTGEQARSNMALRLADDLIEAGAFDRVVLAPIAVGGSDVAQWGAGGKFNHRIGVVCARLRALALPVTAVLWQQGTSDNSLNTPAATYEARLSEVIATFRAQPGMERVPFLVGNESWVEGDIDFAVRAGQKTVIDPAAFVFPGADCDKVTARRDAAHLTSEGAAVQSQIWRDALLAALG